MKTLMVTLLVGTVMFSASVSRAGGEGWGTDFEKAKKEAAERNVPILVNFSGSDWCGWCKRLEGEVFSKEGFKKFARENVVLFVADFPMRKELEENVSKQNKSLAEKYGVQGFPTVLLLDKDGKVIARTGYRAGGVEKYIEHIRGLVESKKS